MGLNCHDNLQKLINDSIALAWNTCDSENSLIRPLEN